MSRCAWAGADCTEVLDEDDAIWGMIWNPEEEERKQSESTAGQIRVADTIMSMC